jgi:hypothetical protein
VGSGMLQRIWPGCQSSCETSEYCITRRPCRILVICRIRYGVTTSVVNYEGTHNIPADSDVLPNTCWHSHYPMVVHLCTPTIYRKLRDRWAAETKRSMVRS